MRHLPVFNGSFSDISQIRIDIFIEIDDFLSAVFPAPFHDSLSSAVALTGDNDGADDERGDSDSGDHAYSDKDIFDV